LKPAAKRPNRASRFRLWQPASLRRGAGLKPAAKRPNRASSLRSRRTLGTGPTPAERHSLVCSIQAGVLQRRRAPPPFTGRADRARSRSVMLSVSARCSSGASTKEPHPPPRYRSASVTPRASRKLRPDGAGSPIACPWRAERGPGGKRGTRHVHGAHGPPIARAGGPCPRTLTTVYDRFQGKVQGGCGMIQYLTKRTSRAYRMRSCLSYHPAQNCMRPGRAGRS
jgi:hypothetical protein